MPNSREEPGHDNERNHISLKIRKGLTIKLGNFYVCMLGSVMLITETNFSRGLLDKNKKTAKEVQETLE